MDRVLVITDDPGQRHAVEVLLLDHDVRLVSASSADRGLTEIRDGNPDLVLLVLPMKGTGAVDVLRQVRGVEPRLPVIVLTGAGSTDEAIEATKAGAFDYLLAPCGDGELLSSIAQGLDAGRLMRSLVALDEHGDAATGDALIGRSKPMQEIYKAIGRVAPTDATVLIRGESGTGKELVARAIYQHSQRAERPFVVVNCVAIPETLLESELFGHQRGAFTGAVVPRIGKVKQADGGTLFLDEIGDMALSIQAKLLRLLEDRYIEPIGGSQPVPVDVRIIAATNRDLESAISDGRFRPDLYYRLNVVPLALPPLRERLDDVPILCRYFLGRLTRELGIRNLGLTPEACELLATYHWPGNVRELANAMEQCLIFSRGRRIGAEEVSALVLGLESSDTALDMSDEVIRRWVHQSVAFGRDRLLPTVIDHVTRRMLRDVLDITGGNRTRAARLLGMSRPTLLAKMHKYGLD